MTVNTAMPTSTSAANRSSMNPSTDHLPMTGMKKSTSKNAPKPSMIVNMRTRKPQNVTKCASPETFHFSSLR